MVVNEFRGLLNRLKSVTHEFFKTPQEKGADFLYSHFNEIVSEPVKVSQYLSVSDQADDDSVTLRPDMTLSAEQDMALLPQDISEKDLKEAELDSYQNYVN